MGISINVIFLLASLIVFWIIPAIGIEKIVVRIFQIMSLFITYFCGCYTRPNKVAG